MNACKLKLARVAALALARLGIAAAASRLIVYQGLP